jgi:hypothetical protein
MPAKITPTPAARPRWSFRLSPPGCPSTTSGGTYDLYPDSPETYHPRHIS